MQRKIREISLPDRHIVVLVFALLCMTFTVHSQVINNQGAAVSLTTGIVVVSQDAYNISGGNLQNNGRLSLTRHFSNSATTSGNGTFSLGGDWTNTGIFIPGASTVIFNGSANQSIIRPGAEAFYNLSIANTGTAPANRILMTNQVTVSGTLSMSVGNVDPGTFVLFLSNPIAAALNYISATGSRVLGKFERGVAETNNYLFPIGTANYYNPLNLEPNNVLPSGTILSQFLTGDPGSTGLPLPDPPVEIFRAFRDGYWNLTSNGFSTGNFNINLNGTGFVIDTLTSVSRVIKRTNSGDWILDGSHQIADTVNNVVYRNSLTTNISSLGTQFGIGRARPLITTHPQDTIHTCEDTNPVFSIAATGATAFKYTWWKVSSSGDILLENGSEYSGARTPNLTILNVQLDDTGRYYCIVTDRYKNSTRTLNGVLMVYKIPVATATPDAQDHECSNIAFTDILLGESYGVPGSTYVWTRDNPTGIISLMDMSGTEANIGDAIDAGMFNNTTDAPLTVTFTITPIGPAPTYCVGLPITAIVTVNPTPRIVPVNVKPAICFGGTTEIELTTPTVMTNGSITFDYTISITGAPGELIGNISPDNDLNVGDKLIFQYENYSDTLQSVFYSVLPRNIASGCFDGVIETPEVIVHPHPLQDMYISTPLTCAGGSDAVITAVLSRGSKPDSLKWDGPWSYHNYYTTTANTSTVTGLKTGLYQVVVEDDLGCSNSSTEFVSGAELDSYFTVVDKPNGYGTTCPESTDGVLALKENISSTGIAPFEYWILNSSQDTVRYGTLPTINSPLDTTYNLAPGVYKLYIYDANGCVNINYPEVTIVPPGEITVNFEKREYPAIDTVYNISCLGYNNGFVRIDTTYGGSSGYTYKWSTVIGSFTGPDDLDHLDSLTAGTYYLTITDLMGCIKVDSVVLTEPEGMVLTASEVSMTPGGTNISCNGGSDGYIRLTIGGGSGIFIYSWTGPSGFTSTTRDINSLRAGTYTCVVTDVNGCILTPNPAFTLTEPAILGVSTVSSASVAGSYNINCNGGTGSINVTVTGGSGNYTYTWSTTDGSGIVEGAQNQNSLTAGSYHLVVKDQNDCEAYTDVTLTEPQKLEISLAPKDITCFPAGFSNGEIDLTRTGGVAPFTYNWSNGATTEDVTGLTAGTYTVTVTDFNGCQDSASAQINLPPPLLYTKTLSNHNGFGYNVSCYGLSDGTINITTTSGTPPYLYSWQGPDGFTATTPSIEGLRAGDYTLVITDSLQCIVNEVITLTQPGELSMNITLSQSTAGRYNINCAGDRTGTIDITPVNPVGVVDYLWSDGSISQNRTKLGAGDYRLIITDSNLCLADSTITLTEPDSLYLAFTATSPWCQDKPDGSIHVDVTGGVPGADYTYKWSNNATTQDVTNIQPGIFRVTVTDLNSCTISDSVRILPQNETCLIIPNAISPNGDLINDVWNIGLIDLYPQIEVKIFNRWGESVWRSEKGYPAPWDGTSNGKPLPVDSYHYIIDFGDGRKVQVGNVTIVR